MKTRFLFLLLLSTVVAACKKENIQNDLVGSWELRTVNGDMPQLNYSPGNGNILRFTKTEYQTLTNGTITKTGTYTIVADGDFEKSVCLVKKKGEFENRIVYDGDNSSRETFIHIDANKLFLASGCFATDGGAKMEYVKQ